MDPGEVLGDRTGLVGLELADEVPFQGQVGQVGLLGEGLLQVVFAEGELTGAMGGANGRGLLFLADRQQPDAARGPTEPGLRGPDARPDRRQALRKGKGHVGVHQASPLRKRTSLLSAWPRWLRRFLVAGSSSAEVQPSLGTRKMGS